MVGCFLVEIAHDAAAETLFGSVPYSVIGTTEQSPTITLRLDGKLLDTIAMAELKLAWQQPLREVFP